MNKGNSSVLSELEILVENLGTWRDVIVLGGGVALLVYDGCSLTCPKKPPVKKLKKSAFARVMFLCKQTKQFQ